MKRTQRTLNAAVAPLVLGLVCLSSACTETDSDSMDSDMSSSTQMTDDSETMMGDAETAMDSAMGDGDGDSAGDGDGDMGLDCSTIEATGNTPNTVPQNFELPGSDGTIHSLHGYCNEVVYAVAGTMW